MAFATTLRTRAHQPPCRYAALQVSPDLDDADGQSAAQNLVSVVASILRAYRLDGDDLTDAIRLIRSTLHGFIVLAQNEGRKDSRFVDATYLRIVASLDSVVTGWPS